VSARPARNHALAPALFPEGVVADRFEVRSVLGVGGTATVFEAFDRQLGEAVALKAMPRDERMMRRARRELKVAAALDHPAIVRLLDSVEDGDYVYVVFELVRGDDLAAAFRDGLLDDAAVMRATAAVADALAHAHARGVVHRDIKPGNVLLRDDGVLKLTDFGIAHIDHPDATVDDRLLGTLSYMAPEQALGGDVTGAADVWSTALMVYEALVGDNPYRAKTPRELADKHAALQLSLQGTRPELPPVVLRHIDRALSREPGRRPSAEQLRDALLAGARALERGLAGDLTREPDILDDPPKKPRRSPLRAARRLAARARRPAPLAAVPDAPPAAPRWQRMADALGRPVAVPAGRAGLARPATALLAGAACVLGLMAMPFYPAHGALVLGVLLGALALARPGIAMVAMSALVIPVAGNLSLGLVPIACAAGLVWVLAFRGAARWGFLPALAPLAALLCVWPAYLLAAGAAAGNRVRFAAGAAGPLVTALAFGLAGVTSPLGFGVPGAGLASTIAGSEDTAAVAAALWSATGVALLAQAAGWGALAIASRPALRLEGPRLRWFAAAWLSAGYVVTVLPPALAGAPAPGLRTAVGLAAGAILLGFRSVARPMALTGDGE
jgi:eukaryotic-like serine/threonine-protein kinase